jgi:hypothetical protein
MVEPSTCNYNSPIRLQASDDTDVPAYFRFAAFGKPYNLESPFSVLIRSNYTALQRSGKTNAAILVEKQSDSVPLWTRPRNQEPSLSISQTLFPPPFSSAI